MVFYGLCYYEDMQKKDIPWTSAGAWLKKGYRIERFYRVDGEWWVTLQMGLEGSRMAQDARKGGKGR